MIEIRLLGGIGIAGPDGSAGLSVQQPKRLGVLAYLAAARPRGLHRRDTLLGLFWPELDDDRARSALRQALHAIRRSLGADALATEGTERVGLDSARLTCDVWELEAAAARSDHDTVLRLYQGPFLNGLHVSGAHAFDEWMESQRAHLAGLALESAWRAAERAQRSDVVRAANCAVTIAGLEEGAVRRAMELMARAGERGAALSLYVRLSEQLRRELDIDPDAETDALARGLRQPQPAAAAVIVSRADGVPRVDKPSARKRRVARWLVAATLCITAVATAAELAPRRPSYDARRVLVEPAIATDSSPSLALAARLLSRDAREALTTVNNLQVVATAGDDPLEMFNDSSRGNHGDDAGTIVRTTLRTAGDSIEAHIEVVDRATNLLGGTFAVRFVSGQHEAFADRLRATVATAVYPGWGTALSQTLSYQSYLLLVDGLRSIKLEAHEDALRAFTSAYAQDSAFTVAGILAAMELYQLGRLGDADSLARRIGAKRAQLRPIDARLHDWLTRSLAGDRAGARVAMEGVTALAPDAELAWLQLAIDNVETARPREALAALDHIDPRSAFGEVWPSYWATRIEALHVARDHRRELSVARTAISRHPDVDVLRAYELRALAASGRIAEVERAVARMAEVPPVRGTFPAVTIRQTAMELAAHGHGDAAVRIMTAAKAAFEARPAADRDTPQWRAGYARTLYLLGHDSAARGLYETMARNARDCFDCTGVIGVLAARLKDTSAAHTAARSLDRVSAPFTFGRPLLWRARIAATLGDSASAIALLSAAFAAGLEFDVLTHADPDLKGLDPDRVYREFVRQ